jgi:transcriptional regulator with XRE-family HTH domain
MVYAMTEGFAGRLRALMAGRDLSQHALARKVPCSTAHVSLLAAGKRQPSSQMARRIDDILSAGGELAALATADAGPPADTTAADTAVELVEPTRRAECSDVGSGMIEALFALADRLCRDYPNVAPPALRDRARQYLRYVLDLLGKRTTLRQHRELVVAAGRLAAQLACVCYDAGDPAAAETARRLTRQLGEHAGHGELAGWAFEIAALFALVEGRFADTVELSEAGLARAGVSNAGVQLTLQTAGGYARMGDSRAGQMLANGRMTLDRLPEPEHPEHHFVFDRDKHEFYAATIYTWLGTDDAAACEHAAEVAARCRNADGTPRWPTRLSTTLVNMAVLTSHRADLDEAVSLGTDSLGCGRRSAELLPRAAELEHHLAGRYPHERLTGEYSQILREEVRAVPSRDARWLHEVVGKRVSHEGVTMTGRSPRRRTPRPRPV